MVPLLFVTRAHNLYSPTRDMLIGATEGVITAEAEALKARAESETGCRLNTALQGRSTERVRVLEALPPQADTAERWPSTSATWSYDAIR
jgi:hypothetical protein